MTSCAPQQMSSRCARCGGRQDCWGPHAAAVHLWRDTWAGSSWGCSEQAAVMGVWHHGPLPGLWGGLSCSASKRQVGEGGPPEEPPAGLPYVWLSFDAPVPAGPSPPASRASQSGWGREPQRPHPPTVHGSPPSCGGRPSPSQPRGPTSERTVPGLFCHGGPGDGRCSLPNVEPLVGSPGCGGVAGSGKGSQVEGAGSRWRQEWALQGRPRPAGTGRVLCPPSGVTQDERWRVCTGFSRVT